MKAARANRLPPNAALISLRVLRLNPPEDSEFRRAKCCVHQDWHANGIRNSSNYHIRLEMLVTKNAFISGRLGGF
jgi:hypothetical protein